MSIHILEPRPGKRIAAIEVPERTTGYRLMNKAIVFHINYTNTLIVDLPEGKFEPLGLSTELTEEQCLDIIPVNPSENINVGKMAFASFMLANGLVDRNNDPDNERVKKYLILIVE